MQTVASLCLIAHAVEFGRDLPLLGVYLAIKDHLSALFLDLLL